MVAMGRRVDVIVVVLVVRWNEVDVNPSFTIVVTGALNVDALVIVVTTGDADVVGALSASFCPTGGRLRGPCQNSSAF